MIYELKAVRLQGLVQAEFFLDMRGHRCFPAKDIGRIFLLKSWAGLDFVFLACLSLCHVANLYIFYILLYIYIQNLCMYT